MPKCYRTLLLALAIAALVPAAAAAAVIPISQLHHNDANGQTLMIGQTVTVRGIVTGQFPTTGAASSTRLYIQDPTRGVNVFGVPPYCGGLGDDITVTGVVGQYRGLVEVASPPDMTITPNGTGQPQPTPVLLTIAQINAIVSAGVYEPFESVLIGVLNCTIKNPGGGAPIPTGVVSVIGVLSQYSPSTPPYIGGWRLMPRSWRDIQNGTTPHPSHDVGSDPQDLPAGRPGSRRDPGNARAARAPVRAAPVDSPRLLP